MPIVVTKPEIDLPIIQEISASTPITRPSASVSIPRKVMILNGALVKDTMAVVARLNKDVIENINESEWVVAMKKDDHQVLIKSFVTLDFWFCIFYVFH